MSQTKEQVINAAIKQDGVDTNLISDGYHTFGELYEHRIVLYIILLRTAEAQMDGMNAEPLYDKGTFWKSKAHSDGSVWDGWFILGAFTEPGKQITYHLPIEKWDECFFAKELDKAPEWDGHTSADVLERLKNL